MPVTSRSTYSHMDALRVIDKAVTATRFYVVVTPPLPSLEPTRFAVRPRMADVRLSRAAAKRLVKELLWDAPPELGIALSYGLAERGVPAIWVGGKL